MYLNTVVLLGTSTWLVMTILEFQICRRDIVATVFHQTLSGQFLSHMKFRKQSESSTRFNGLKILTVYQVRTVEVLTMHGNACAFDLSKHEHLASFTRYFPQL